MMNNFKKALTVFMVVALMGTMLVGCGSGAGESAEVATDTVQVDGAISSRRDTRPESNEPEWW